MIDLNFSAAQITQTLEKLRFLTQLDVQANWRYCPQDVSIPSIDSSDWEIAQPNDKGYLTWSAERQVCWFAQRFVIPHALQVYPLTGLALRLVLTWWADDAKIFVNGQLVQEGDLFDSSVRILLTSSANPGEEILVALRLVSPGHDIGALMRSKCVYEKEGTGSREQRGMGRWRDRETRGQGDKENFPTPDSRFPTPHSQGRWKQKRRQRRWFIK
ncbi:MAG: hypothetical protein ACRDEA_22105, partial [Microcystaceae cyanobacterium]